MPQGMHAGPALYTGPRAHTIHHSYGHGTWGQSTPPLHARSRACSSRSGMGAVCSMVPRAGPMCSAVPDHEHELDPAYEVGGVQGMVVQCPLWLVWELARHDAHTSQSRTCVQGRHYVWHSPRSAGAGITAAGSGMWGRGSGGLIQPAEPGELDTPFLRNGHVAQLFWRNLSWILIFSESAS